MSILSIRMRTRLFPIESGQWLEYDAYNVGVDGSPDLIGTVQAQFVLSTFLRVFHAPVTQWLEYDAYNVGADGSPDLIGTVQAHYALCLFSLE